MTEIPTPYPAAYRKLCKEARKHGYALAIHGSLTRDLDVLAVPWVTKASSAEVLVVALAKACGALNLCESEPVEQFLGTVSEKPHGRKAWVLLLTHMVDGGAYVDLGVMPREG